MSGFDPGGTNSNEQTPAHPYHSYADRLKTNIKYDQRLQQNILEIILEIQSSDVESELQEDDIKQLFETIGIDTVTELVGYQVKFEKISVWLKPNVKLDKFCKEERIRVSPGITTSFIKPAGRNDVTVTVAGLNFNTPDTFVIEYIKNFGRVIGNSVIYSKYTEGPFKDKFNGERKYQVDFSENKSPMGTYHIIDGERVKVYYRGNRKTCARCHQFSEKCPGGGSAKECEESGGSKVMLVSHMKKLWESLKFVPNSFERDLDKLGLSRDNHVLIRDSVRFPPLVDKSCQEYTDPNKFTGIAINNFSLKATEDDIYDVLCDVGGRSLKNLSKSDIKINKSTKNPNVIIEPLMPSVIAKLQKALDFPETNVKHFGFPLYCRPIRRLTPTMLPQNKNNALLDGPASSTPESSKVLSRRQLKNKKKLQKSNENVSKALVGLPDPPGLEDFEFSDYSECDSFEDTKETQNSSDESSDTSEEFSVSKRQATSPINKEDLKRFKKTAKETAKPNCKK